MNDFQKRMGPDPHSAGLESTGLRHCPDVWLLADGNFAVIGKNMTAAMIEDIPGNVSIGPDEALVVVPRDVMLRAANAVTEEAHGLD